VGERPRDRTERAPEIPVERVVRSPDRVGASGPFLLLLALGSRLWLGCSSGTAGWRAEDGTYWGSVKPISTTGGGLLLSLPQRFGSMACGVGELCYPSQIVNENRINRVEPADVLPKRNLQGGGEGYSDCGGGGGTGQAFSSHASITLDY